MMRVFDLQRCNMRWNATDKQIYSLAPTETKKILKKNQSKRRRRDDKNLVEHRNDLVSKRDALHKVWT